MRKVEKRLIDAMRMWEDFKESNTSLHVVQKNGVNQYCEVRLHGHAIAAWDGNSINISMCGYNTRTTKSRLNALIGEFNEPTGHNYRIGTHKGYTYIYDHTSGNQYEMYADGVYNIGYEVKPVKSIDDFGV